jgi:adenosylhomocysteinase
MTAIAKLRKNYDIKDLSLASAGRKRIDWAAREMPVLGLIKKRFSKEKPLKNYIVSACLHVTSETANLVKTLISGGAKVNLCASNPLSTQDEVAASLVKHEGISVFAVRGASRSLYYRHIHAAINAKPHITMDDGADIISTVHKNWNKNADKILGATEETTTGVIRLKAMERDGALRYPIIAVNSSDTKYMFDNRYGTGQSTLDGIIRATNILISGKTVAIAGYGWCGRGTAMRAKGMGAKVIVTEIDPVKALEAAMDGFLVMPMEKACKYGDIFVTVTGNINVIDTRHFKLMKNNAVVCNSGHFDVEINVGGLKKIAKRQTNLRPLVEQYTLGNGKNIVVLAGGRLVNLACAEGHPASVMDMSFANQALAAEFIVKNSTRLSDKVYALPKAIDQNIAKLKLACMGVKFDKLNFEQKKYLNSWKLGT